MSDFNELDNVVSLTDQDGNEEQFELLDVVDVENESFLILLPVEDDAGEVIILKQIGEDEENEEYAAVTDEALAQKIFDLFKERNPELCEE